MQDHRNLARSAIKSIRLEASKCANCPPEVAVSLAEEFPSEFLRNPMLETACLEVPDLLSSLSNMALSKIVSSPECPGYFIDGVIGHGSRLAHSMLLKHYRLSEQDLEIIASKNRGRPSEEARRRLLFEDYSTTRYRL